MESRPKDHPIDTRVKNQGLRAHQWRYSYRTSSTVIDGRPLNMLHDFYIPALKCAVQYDRVAGYFRSTSLAAASRGFSAFVGRGGRMRLIVGADLEPEDVKAVLEGDARRLENRLGEALEGEERWPDEVRNGVTLLAWMVAHGHLELKVALRVHRDTGEPLPFDSVEDGYVHEKWFILRDEFGNRLYGSGSLNESKTALALNAENIDVHCDWWEGRDRKRVDEAEADFQHLWEGDPKSLRIMPLPEAVQKRLVRFAEHVKRPVEVDGTSAAQEPEQASPSGLERLQFAVLRDGPKMPGGHRVGMETAPVAPWPHQSVVVERLVETWPYSHLLCDEVGLGKTIEAGLAFRSLYLSGLAKRILVAAPAGLTIQWQRQMASKMLMSFGRVQTGSRLSYEYIFPEERRETVESMFEGDLLIVSTGLIARNWARELDEAPRFDVILVDEAHMARRKNPSKGPGVHPDYGNLYNAVKSHLRPRAKALWLATATPMQIHPVEVCDLLALTNRVGAFQFDPTLTLEYYNVLGSLIQEKELDQWQWEFLRRAVKAVRHQDPWLWNFIQNYVIDSRIQSVARRWLEEKQPPRGRDRQRMLRLMFAASPLARVMMRHTRKLLEEYRDRGELADNLARRRVLPVEPVPFEPSEARIYKQLQQYSRGLARRLGGSGGGAGRQMVSFLLSFLRLRFASSFYAFEQTLERRLHKVEYTLHAHTVGEASNGETGDSASLEEAVTESEIEDDDAAVVALLKDRTKEDLEWERSQLKAMLKALGDLQGPSSKMKRLLRILDGRKDPVSGRFRQTVIFTRFYDTLRDILSHLRQAAPRMRIGTYSGKGAEWFAPDAGGRVEADREEIKERFLQGEIDILLCTDAAAEGLNLQTADMLINFDLGWNPMKIEQRIGRIDRIGQRHPEIFVVNLCYAGSEEEVVYGRLLQRLQQANLVVGPQQMSLLPVQPDEFHDLAEGKLDISELEKRLRDRLEKQREQEQTMQIDSKDLYDIYQSLVKEQGRRRIPVDLDTIWEALSGSAYLRKLGCSVREVAGEPVLMVPGLDGIGGPVWLTTSRQLHDTGLPEREAGERVPLHFASYGDPVFEALLDHMEQHELPGCIKRLTVSSRSLPDVSLVGYAVLSKGKDGMSIPILVQGWEDLKGITLAENEVLTEADVEPLRETLRRRAEEEFRDTGAAQRYERYNERVGHLQEWLNDRVAYDLLQAKGLSLGGKSAFSTLVESIQGLCESREKLLVTDLPADILLRFPDDLLFDPGVIPSSAAKADVEVPCLMVRAAVDAMNRVASGMKQRSSELSWKTVAVRLQRDAIEKEKLL